ncbi:hypothetical protein PYCCODRAFT_1426103 [Trametes coccinea BRFM310]|uniref:Uncharacterized protein n=1 Tax=Trametes coccinea (strain BRFM310) TaxID=1353009 RepID=A0A1Y2IKL1_TRAC3|nr:hypothetical protein PYCCODRAFT_1426103 [Trametes coccinea BRFM310]
MDLCNIGEEVFQPNAAGLVTRDNAAFARGVVRHPCWNHFMYYAGLIKSMRVNAAELQPGMIALLSSFVPDDSSILCSLRQLYWEECGHGDELLYLAGGALQVLSIVVLDPQDGYMTERVFADWVERLCNKLVCLSPELKLLEIRGSGTFRPDPSPLAYFNRLHRVPICVYGIGDNNERYTVDRGRWDTMEEVVLSSHVGSKTLVSAFNNIVPLLNETLRTVELHSEIASWPHESTRFLNLAKPVLALTGLVCVEISLPHYFLKFTAEDLVVVASALPAVEVLYISLDALFACPDIPTFATIGQCMSMCLNLSFLSIPILQGPYGILDSLHLPAPTRHGLMVLHAERVRLVSHLSLRTAQTMMEEALLSTFPRMTLENINLGTEGWIGGSDDLSHPYYIEHSLSSSDSDTSSI